MSANLLILIAFTLANLYFLIARFRKSGKSGGPAGNGTAESIIRFVLIVVVVLGIAGIVIALKGAGAP